MILPGLGLPGEQASGAVTAACRRRLSRLTLSLFRLSHLAAQLKLRDAAVLLVGAGALGCPALQYLAAAGIGASFKAGLHA